MCGGARGYWDHSREWAGSDAGAPPRRERGAPGAEVLGVNVNAQDAFIGAERAKYFAARADGECASGVGEAGVLAAAVDTEDEGLVFDGAGDGEDPAVFLAGVG